MRYASGLGFEPLSIIVGILWLAVLALVRLISEIPTRTNGEDVQMNKNTNQSKMNAATPARSYWQYLAETVWAAGAGVSVTPLAS